MRCCGAHPSSNPITRTVRVQFIAGSRMGISSNIRVSHESSAWEMDFFSLDEGIFSSEPLKTDDISEFHLERQRNRIICVF